MLFPVFSLKKWEIDYFLVNLLEKQSYFTRNKRLILVSSALLTSVDPPRRVFAFLDLLRIMCEVFA